MKKPLLIPVLFILIILLVRCAPEKEKKNSSTGTIIPELAPVDMDVNAFMSKWKIPGGSVAIVKDGHLVYARGFGYAEPMIAAQPDNLYRVASLSKPITAVAILKLVEDGKISLDQKIFGPEGILNDLQYLTITDSRIKEITVTHLLEHTAGWDRDVSPCGDPMFDPLTIATCMNATAPASAQTVIRYMLTKPLDFSPGSRYAYSNFGYNVLGRVIEKITGMNYEEYVKENILAPAGIKSMRMGKSILSDKNNLEALYHDYSTKQVPSVCEPGKNCDYPYGGFYLEAMDAHGGWIASAIDLAKFLVATDGKNNDDLLQKNSLNTMQQASSVNSGYGKGWFVNSSGNRWHTGCLIGSSSLMANISNGIGWVLLFNAYPGSSEYFQEMDRLMWNALEKVKTWPTKDLFTEKPARNTKALG